ncbi:MAG TPA: lysophospholipase [Ktedonobacterales bacterium]|nr:lysophospholipase [Ktedonobacterales bacterium]
MAMVSKYTQERVGEWGVPTTAVSDSYDTATLTLTDGVNLFYRRWQTPDAAAPTLVVMHGLGAHSGWFIDMGNELNKRGLAVYAMDYRGFGRSGGPRGHVRSGSVYIQDLTAFLTEVKRQRPDRPLFILGHSMGGIFALHLAVEDARSGANRIAGMILMNPWIADSSKVSPFTALGLMLGGMRGSTRRFKTGDDTTIMTLNPEATTMLKADTYWVREETASFLFQITAMRMATLSQARKIRIPALIVQAEEDRSVVAAASKKAHDALASADKTWKTYPGYAHDSELEADRSALDDDIAQWVLAHTR